jgi:hypothetical protein
MPSSASDTATSSCPTSCRAIRGDIANGSRSRCARAGASWIGGLHSFDDVNRVFPLEVCPIAHPRLVECWSAMRRHLRGLPVPRPDQALRLSLRLHDANGDRVTLVVLGASHWDDGEAWAAQIRTACQS